MTRLARERLTDAARPGGPAGLPGPVHEIEEPRALSAASARDVAAFIVRANAAALAGRGADSPAPGGVR